MIPLAACGPALTKLIAPLNKSFISSNHVCALVNTIGSLLQLRPHVNFYHQEIKTQCTRSIINVICSSESLSDFGKVL